jgi:hypothetical protein
VGACGEWAELLAEGAKIDIMPMESNVYFLKLMDTEITFEM